MHNTLHSSRVSSVIVISLCANAFYVSWDCFGAARNNSSHHLCSQSLDHVACACYAQMPSNRLHLGSTTVRYVNHKTQCCIVAVWHWHTAANFGLKACPFLRDMPVEHVLLGRIINRGGIFGCLRGPKEPAFWDSQAVVESIWSDAR
jgi:hypothetical protein